MSLAIVTGATGWLGSTLVGALLADRRVRALVCGSPAGLDPRVDLVPGDLRTGAGIEQLFRAAKGATVFHCAGVIHPNGGPREFHAVNAAGTRRLLAAAKRAGVRRFIHVSSNSAVGVNGSPAEVFDESAPYRPASGYGESKRSAEEAVLAERNALEIVIIRPPWFYGPRQPARQSTFFQMIRAGRGPLLDGGKNRRSMAYVDNVTQGLLLAERVEAAKGNVYWIADERPYEMTEILDTVERLLEQEFGLPCAHRRLRLPGLASEVAGFVDTSLQALGRYNQKVHVLSELNKTIACSIAKAQRELGYAPAISLEEGMRRSIRWLLDHGGEI